LELDSRLRGNDGKFAKSLLDWIPAFPKIAPAFPGLPPLKLRFLLRLKVQVIRPCIPVRCFSSSPLAVGRFLLLQNLHFHRPWWSRRNDGKDAKSLLDWIPDQVRNDEEVVLSHVFVFI